MPAGNPVEGDTAPRQPSPIQTPNKTAIVTDEYIHVTRIPTEPVGRRDRLIIVLEPGHLRRPAVFLRRGRHRRWFGAVPNHLTAQVGPAFPKIAEAVAAG